MYYNISIKTVLKCEKNLAKKTKINFKNKQIKH